MPVMGRFRLRRESRRAFLQSGFAVKGPVHSFAENLICRLLRGIMFARKPVRRRSIGPLLKVLTSRSSVGTRKQALHLPEPPGVR